MKKLKVLSALSLLAVAGAAHAEISGSMGIASSYLWRGYDLGAGHGVPAISGDLHYSNSGFYGGIWGSSGDYVNGTEYDLYAGYGGSAGAFTYDVSYWTYSYPSTRKAADLTDSNGDAVSGYLSDLNTLRPGSLSEVVISLGIGPVSAFLLHNVNHPAIDANGDYSYYGLKGKFGAFTAVVGHHNDQASKLTHADLSYAYNDNLSFTVSVPVDVASGYEKPGDPTFVASYSVPFGK
jgi:hypothetical protein